MASKAQTAEVTVQIYMEDVRRLITDRVGQQVEALFEKTFEDVVSSRVAQLVDEVAGAEIRKAVKDALAEGWQQTNTYGEAHGPKVGLKGRVAELLTKQEGDYNKRQTRVEKIATEVIDAAFRAEFGKEITAARERFKAQLDSVVAAKFTDTIKAALGLR